ncbi:MAG TPA: phosphodiester glycosidase family protein [Actinomycetota bacterium]|nr:phosphodiester glycosidase family protein [Actinomycetota bacterium]
MRAGKPTQLAIAMLLSGAAIQALPEGRGAMVDAEAASPAGEVLFATTRDGDFEIYSMASDGTAQRNLTQASLTADVDPAWSLGGGRIAFSRYLPGNPTAEMYLMDPDGSRKVRLTRDYGVADDREPTWSRSGNLIAFTRSVPASGSSRISVIRADGTGRRPLTRARPRGYDSSPAWSPVGGRIAFVSDRSGGFPDIWVMNSDGTEPTRLTKNRMVDANPAWSPDGTRIAFERCCPDRSSEIYVMNADGTQKIRLTATPANEMEPTWSADSSMIAFAMFPPGGGNRDVHAVNVDGTGERALTIAAAADVAPDWQRPVPPLPEPAPSPAPTDTPEPTPSPSAQTTSTPSTPEASPDADGTPSPEPTGTSTPEPSPSTGDGGQSGALQGSVAKGVPLRALRPRYRVLESKRLFKGLRYRKILDRRGPNRIYVLRMNPLLRPTLDVALEGGDLPGLAPTSRIAAAHGAVAAVNGDFSLEYGRPAHTFAEDGSFHQTTFAYSTNVAVSHREDAAYFRHPTPRMSVLQTQSGDVIRVDRWNRGEPTWGEVGGYTPAGSWLERPPSFACSARLVPAGPKRWTAGELGIARDYLVDEAACRRRRMAREGGVVVSAQPGSLEALLIRSLAPGERVTWTWSFGWAGVGDSIGGYPLLLRDGETMVTECSASICFRHPRTAIGVDAEGRILLVVVDGRRRRSVGMDLVDLANLLRRLGAVSALNLDGGGSSTMVVRGQVVNRPSDGHERPRSTAVLVLDGQDPGERTLAPARATAPGDIAAEERASPVQGDALADGATRVDRLALFDPASTGGLLDAMDRGLFGSRGLPPGLRMLLRGLRASGWTEGATYRARSTRRD